MAKFEVVSRFADAGIQLPDRKTAGSGGYDLAAAEDIVIPSIETLRTKLYYAIDSDDPRTEGLSLKEMEWLTKRTECRPTLVSTGLKCQLDPGTYLELSVRSSTPLKYWLILANSVGVIDSDYYNNPGNEGEIFLQFFNLAPFPLLIKKGDYIGQAIIHSYSVTEDDAVANVKRVGGFGSTTK